MRTRILCLLFMFIIGPAQATTVLELAPGHKMLDTSRIEPFEVTFRYRRANNPDPQSGTRVTWRLEKISLGDSPGDKMIFRTTLITHAAATTFADINEFDAETFAHIASRIPTQLEDGSLADVSLRFSESRVTATITPRGSGQPESFTVELPRAVMGGGFDLIPATLDLEPGMTIRYPKFDFANRTLVWAEGKIVGRETLQTALGIQQTWKIETRDGKGWHWINAKPPYVYRRLFTINDDLSILWEVATD